MSKSGKVISWRGPFGFAEMDDKTLVYIHTTEIDEGKLRVGLSVNFDTEEVDGHGGKLKGTNVSGDAVLAKGAKLVCFFFLYFSRLFNITTALFFTNHTNSLMKTVLLTRRESPP